MLTASVSEGERETSDVESSVRHDTYTKDVEVTRGKTRLPSIIRVSPHKTVRHPVALLRELSTCFYGLVNIE